MNPRAAGRTDGVQFEAPRAKETTMAMGAQFGGGVSGRVSGKVRAVRLLATVTLETGTSMMTKVLGLVPFAAPQAKVVYAKIRFQFGDDVVMALVG